jgi:hexosaminidase
LENKLFNIPCGWLFKPTKKTGSLFKFSKITNRMFKLWIIGLILLTAVVAFAENKVHGVSLMPVPAGVTWSDGTCRVDSTFTVSIRGDASDRLYRAASRMLRRVTGRTGLFVTQAYVTRQDADLDALMEIRVEQPGNVVLYEDESYRLQIEPEQIKLDARTDLGAMHGMETVLQLLSADKKGYFLPAVMIDDAPRFPWRGLMIDACRHFMPVEVVKRNLDGMTAVKLNVLHWHLTEDQGFRVESKVFPKLQELGSDGLYYTQDQIRDIISYAADRGIRVVPEFDLPGHATSWLVAYPELASAPGPYQIERGWGIFDPTFNPTIEATYSFLDKFLQEMSQLFTDDYMHIGGDENNGRQWDANPEIQDFMKAHDIPDNHTLQSYFNRRLLEILTKHGKRMVGWEEILHPDMPKNIVIQSWRGAESLVQAATMGYQVMLSRGYYIDLIQPTDYHYLNDPDPDSLDLTPEQRKLIIGGEATMWAEFVSPETVDSRIWPRTAAIAERLWSPAEVRDVDDMYQRLEDVSFRLEELGLTHEKNYLMMLRRLTGNQDITALKTLVDVLEPVKIYRRNQLREQFSYTPLTRVVDAARPDAAAAREFRNMVAAYLSKGVDDAGLREEIENRLKIWEGNHKILFPIMESSPVLHEIMPMSQNLSAAADLGRQALELIKNGKTPDAVWTDEANALLADLKKPVAQTELMILPGISSLVQRSAGAK